MRILITGNEGFIGSKLEKFLSNLGYQIIGLDIKSGNNILDCRLPECDLCIHLAGIGGVRESIIDPLKYWIHNVEGTKRILTHYKNIRVLVAGSSSQYEPYLNPYAATKNIIESIPHKNVCFMRFHTVYSENPRPGMFFDKLLNNSLEYVTDHERDFIHINDLCQAILLIIKSNIHGSIDIGSGISYKLTEICPNFPVIKDTQYERKKTLADISKLKSIGFLPEVDVYQFLKNFPKNIRR